MPTMTYTPQSYSDPSSLMEGVHPAFCVAVTEEPIPEGWEMGKTHKLMYRWHFAVLDSVASLGMIPEYQTAVSSPIFSAAGKQVSKAYAWISTMLGRAIAVNESIDTDTLLPLPCQLFIGRRDKQGNPSEYATIQQLLPWPEGAALLTPELKAKLALWWKMKQAGEPAAETAPAPVAAPRYAQPASPTQAPAPAPQPATAGRTAW